MRMDPGLLAWQATGHGRAFARDGLDGDLRANDVGPIFHDVQAHPGADLGNSEAFSVIPDGEAERLAIAQKFHPDLSRFAVLDRVGDRFLRDTVEVERDDLVANPDLARAVEVAGDGARLAGAKSEFAERVGEALGRKFDRVQAAGEIAGKADIVVYDARGFLERPRA